MLLEGQQVVDLLRASEEPGKSVPELIEVIKTLLASRVKQYDPFEKVLLTKSIDN